MLLPAISGQQHAMRQGEQGALVLPPFVSFADISPAGGIFLSSSPAALSSFMSAGWCSAFPTLSGSPRWGRCRPRNERRPPTFPLPTRAAGASAAPASGRGFEGGRGDQHPGHSLHPASARPECGGGWGRVSRTAATTDHLHPAGRGGAADATASCHQGGLTVPQGPTWKTRATTHPGTYQRGIPRCSAPCRPG